MLEHNAVRRSKLQVKFVLGERKLFRIRHDLFLCPLPLFGKPIEIPTKFLSYKNQDFWFQRFEKLFKSMNALKIEMLASGF